MDIINEDRENSFKLDCGGYQLGSTSSKPASSVDTTTITAKHIGDTFYRVLLDRVQYGTAKGKKACLITFTFEFDFRRNTIGRFKSAQAIVYFKPIADAALKLPYRPPEDDEEDDDDDDDDELDTQSLPHIIRILPISVYGKPTIVEKEDGWNVQTTLGIGMPVSASGVVARNGKTVMTREERMSIEGYKRGARQRLDGDDVAIWKMHENSALQDGIPLRFQAAVVLRWPATGGIVASVDVKTEVVFSFSHAISRLLAKDEHPIAFDGQTPRGEGIELGKDFEDKDFNWTKAIMLPTEYEVSSATLLLIERGR